MNGSITPIHERTWLDLCITDGKQQKPVANVHNALLALRNDQFREAIGYDEMLCAPMIVHEPDGTPQRVADEDIVYIQEWMQAAGLKRIGRDIVRDAVFTYAKERPYHPVRDYLDSLEWDKTKRLNTWLMSCLGCENTPYTASVGKWFLISMVARIYRPGCKVDTMLVLEGPQGKLKSTVCEILAGQYFSDDLPEIHVNNKDAKVHLAGKWLIEIAELHAFGKAESTQLKSFLSRRRELYRPPYGRLEVDQPRQCVFMGTTNKDRYLIDETGGRRFWGVRCGHISIELLRHLRDQLFAEAVDAFRCAIPWWPDEGFQKKYITPEQDDRYQGDAWEETLKTYCVDKTFVTTKELATSGIQMPLERVNRGVEMRLAAIMRTIGWHPVRVDGIRGFRPPFRTNGG
ncbi:MAG: hypothetical protein J2P16_01140 [Mycobacterium sp.]|nr:hypothetical protein [Mycobacterium sp.]